MLFTLKKPKSERFFQLTFDGFKPGGRNKLEKLINLLSEFFRTWYLYFLKRGLQAILLPLKFVFLSSQFIAFAKSYITQKLIWSRGRLGRPVATFSVMSMAFMVFIVGKLLNSSKLVNSQELDQDFVSNVTDIVPQRNVALTTVPDERKRSESFVYIVEGGDTLSGIGEKFKISSDALKYVNNLTDNSVLKVGQQVVIPPVTGLIHKVESGDTLQSIANKYSVPAQAVADFNYILDVSKLASGTELVIPGAKVPARPNITTLTQGGLTLPPASSDPGPSKDWCIWPSTTRIVTQDFSWYHNGVDIATPWGANMPALFACYDGVVTRAGWDPWGLGLHVRIKHSNGYETIYGHMSRLDVGYGDTVERGDVIGLMGSTGRSTGPHVHFMVNYNGVPQNPLNYIK